MEVSVVICTHDPRADYIGRTLDALRAQTLPLNAWELLLVDNRSQEPLAQRLDLSWQPHGRHIPEPELGVSIARLRGMSEARGAFVVFVDDDNVLEPTYLADALRIGGEWPRLGVWGSGAIIPEFETQPSPYVAKILPYLALRSVDAPRWGNVPSHEITPWGAGLVMRKSVADAYRAHMGEARIKILSRRGAQVLLSGEDVEMTYVACGLGMGIGIFPELKLTHLIPSRRVDKKYLLGVVEGTQISDALIARKWKGTLPASPMRPAALLSVLKQLILLRGIDREVYLANLRATLRARRMIATAEGAGLAG